MQEINILEVGSIIVHTYVFLKIIINYLNKQLEQTNSQILLTFEKNIYHTYMMLCFFESFGSFLLTIRGIYCTFYLNSSSTCLCGHFLGRFLPKLCPNMILAENEICFQKHVTPN